MAEPTPTVEDYLMIIRIMQRDGKAVIGAKLATWMGVSAPTVSVTLKRMVRDGWLEMDSEQRFVLTLQGRQAADTVMRRHMLTEHLLTRMLGVPWSRIHAEAGRLEHTLSDMTTERMAEVLNDPAVCPHGNPLPGNENILAELSPLSDARPGSRWRIMRVDEEGEENQDLLNFMEEQGLLPGVTVIVTGISRVNQTVTVTAAERTVVLGLSAARHLYARPAQVALELTPEPA